MTESLVASGLTYLYPSGRGIRDVSFSASPGDLLCISGSNGSGKTTLIKVLSTLYRPRQGSISMNGVDVFSHKQQARQSFFPVLDETGHIGHANGAGNIGFFLDLYRSAAHDRIDPYARHFDLDLDLPVGDYSLGMRRKLVLIEAFLSGKSILLFDEPTLGLDSSARSAFFRFASEYSDQGTTIVFGTNRDEEAVKSGKILFMDAGRISGNPPSTPSGMIELRVVMEQDEFTEYVLTPEEIPDVISRMLHLGVPREIRIRSREEGDLVWTDAALEKAGRAPPLVRKMVIRVVERYARGQGYRRITPEVVDEAKQRFEPR